MSKQRQGGTIFYAMHIGSRARFRQTAAAPRPQIHSFPHDYMYI